MKDKLIAALHKIGYTAIPISHNGRLVVGIDGCSDIWFIGVMLAGTSPELIEFLSDIPVLPVRNQIVFPGVYFFDD